jgi:type IV pilus assembly protein PilB
MLFTPEIRHIIVAADELVDEDKLRKTATEQGMLTLQASARERVRNGETSIQEMMRVVFTDF